MEHLITQLIISNGLFYFLLVLSREPADELLYRLRVTEVRAAWEKTVDDLGLGPIDFAPHVRKHIQVCNNVT